MHTTPSQLLSKSRFFYPFIRELLFCQEPNKGGESNEIKLTNLIRMRVIDIQHEDDDQPDVSACLRKHEST